MTKSELEQIQQEADAIYKDFKNKMREIRGKQLKLLDEYSRQLDSYQEKRISRNLKKNIYN